MTGLQYTGERAIPWDMRTGAHILNRHVMRYAWAVPWAYGKRVLDLGCGAGYGSFLLSWGALVVLGVDMSAEALRFAETWFEAPNLLYRVLDVSQESVPAADVYVAFEILEHLDDPIHLLESLRGTLLWSLPVNDGSQFHKRAYNLTEIVALVPGSAIWYQARDGTIVPRDRAWFTPVNVVGAATL